MGRQPVNETVSAQADTDNEGIEIGDTVYSSKYGYWWLHGKPQMETGVVTKKSAAGRLCVTVGETPNGYSDRQWFKTREEAWAYWRGLCEAKIAEAKRQIHDLESFRGTLHD